MISPIYLARHWRDEKQAQRREAAQEYIVQRLTELGYRTERAGFSLQVVFLPTLKALISLPANAKPAV